MTRKMLRHCLILFTLAAILLPASPAAAQVFRVTITGDPAPEDCDARCSLREAIIAANASPGPDVIRLPKGRIELARAGAGEDAAATGDLDVTETLTILGKGMGKTVVDANALDRVFDAPSGIFVLRRLTITGGDADAGGGIRSWGATLRLREVAVRGNAAASEGGGVNGFTVNVDRSLFAGNTTESSSGAISASDASITNSLFLGNHADLSGGVTTLFFGTSIEFRDTTLTANSATRSAGAIGIDTGTVSLRGVTVVGNRTDGDAGAPGGNGGGIQNNAGTFTIRNTIIAGNTDGAATAAPDCAGDVTSMGASLVRDQTGCTLTAGPGDLSDGTDPRLRPLANNGGPTKTMALRPGSPARNAGDGCEPKDQRGVPRSLGGACDIGAYELVTCFGTVVNRVGTAGPDVLRGTGQRDGLLGLGGRDRLIGKRGSDGLCGGGGRDTLKGGPGKDRLEGGPGRDLCDGGPGRDRARSCDRRTRIP